VIGMSHGGVALDAGCGTGLTTIPLIHHFRLTLGLDYSIVSLQCLASKPAGIGLDLVCSDLKMLPFADETFDAVLCANTLQHLPPGRPQSSAAGELIRVAKPGAPIVISVHHYSREKKRLGWIKEGKPGQAGIDYIFRFTRDELELLFPSARITAMGFKELARVPKIARHLQNLYSGYFGKFAARAGDGHMLLASLFK
jgi:ubiquinone/menaquinone biosynthesis C-methylase UbiE